VFLNEVNIKTDKEGQEYVEDILANSYGIKYD
jgi:hypothetical protein